MNLPSLTISLALASLLAVSVMAAAQDAAARFLDRAETIFVGSLIDAKSSPSADGTLIVTRYVFAVQEALAHPGRDQAGRSGATGATESTLEILEYGGTVGDTTLTLSHGVGYRYGSSYLIFAGRDELGRWRTIGGPQGRLAVSADRSGHRMVRLYPGHPLSAWMNGPPRLFRRLEEIRARLRDVHWGPSQ